MTQQPPDREAIARIICKTWQYEWDGNPDSDDQVAPDTCQWDDRPSKELFLAAADAILSSFPQTRPSESGEKI